MITKSEEINQIEISIENREAVIKEYAPMIKYVAIRIAKRLPPHIEAVSYTHLTLPTSDLV